MLECFLIMFWIVIVPFGIGTLILNQLLKEEKLDFLLAIVCGAFFMLAVFYVLAMPMMFLKVSFHVLVISWSILMVFLCGLSLFFNRKHLQDQFSYNIKEIKKLPWFTIFVLILIMIQALILAGYQHEDADDAQYVASSTTAISTDSIFQYDPNTGLAIDAYPARYVLSPFPIFIALLSKVMLIHPAILAHTIIPAVLIPFSYAIMAVLGKKLFSDKPSAVVLFLFFLCVLNIFGYISKYTNSTFLLFRIWQGKAVLANIVIPAILYFSFRAMQVEKKFGEWMMLFACSLTACLVSSMGIILAPIMISCLGLVFAVRNRKPSTFVYSIASYLPCIVFGIVSVIL